MKNNVNKNLRIILSFSGIFLGMAIFFTILSTLIYSLQSSKIHENLINTKIILDKEGKYPRYFNSEFLKKDNFTDRVMILIAEYHDSDSSDAFKDALLNNFYYEPDPDKKSGEITTVVSYARYWHGYLIPLKLQHIYTDIKGIRITNYILMSLLLIVATVLIWKKISVKAACIFAASVLIVGVPMAPVCMQFCTCFYIMLISVILILTWPRLSSSHLSLYLSLFVIGGFTSYLDFLTVPIITLGFPLAIACLKSHGQYNLYSILKASLSWLLGYGGIWASKWVLATIFTDFNVIEDAFSSIEYRTFDTTGIDVVISKITQYLTLLILIIFISMLLCVLFRKDSKTLKHYSFLVIIGCYPLIWYAVLQNHSLLHCWFTWRALSLTFFCWGLYCLEIIDFNALLHGHIKKLSFTH